MISLPARRGKLARRICSLSEFTQGSEDLSSRQSPEQAKCAVGLTATRLYGPSIS